MTDPIVEEIRQARAKLLQDCREDLEKLMDFLQAAEEKEDRSRIVTAEALREKRKGEVAKQRKG